MWRDLGPVGRSAASGGYFRQPFTPAERECQAWFAQEAAGRSLEVEYDGFGNAVAWWDPPAGIVREEMAPESPKEGPFPLGLPGRAAVLTGSHLDSVLDGGAYDGPLGVVSAFAAVDLLRDRGFIPATGRSGSGRSSRRRAPGSGWPAWVRG